MTDESDTYWKLPVGARLSLAERWPLLPPAIRVINAAIEGLRQRLFDLRGPYPWKAISPKAEAEVAKLTARKTELTQQVDAMAIKHFGLIPNRTLVRGHGWNKGQLAIYRELIRADYDSHAPWLRVTVVEPADMCGKGQNLYTGWELAGAEVTDAILATVAEARERVRREALGAAPYPTRNS